MEIVEIAADIQTEEQINELIARRMKEDQSNSGRSKLLKKLVLHSNSIQSFPMDRMLSWVHSLVHLDLSSNELMDMVPLSLLVSLEYLNLSNNKINEIAQLPGMTQLKWIDLSYNQIQSLEPLKCLHGDAYSLRFLSVKCNRIKELREFYHLVGLQQFKHLVFSETEDESDNIDSLLDNPCCFQKIQIRSYLFQSLPKILSIDGFDSRGNIVHPELDVFERDTSKFSSALCESRIINSEAIVRQITDQITSNFDQILSNQRSHTITAETKGEPAEKKDSHQNDMLVLKDREIEKLKSDILSFKDHAQQQGFEVKRLSDANEWLKQDNIRAKEELSHAQKLLERANSKVEEKESFVREMVSEHERQMNMLRRQIDSETMRNVQYKQELETGNFNVEAIVSKYEQLEQIHNNTKKSLDEALAAVRLEKVKTERLSFKLEKAQEEIKQTTTKLKDLEDINLGNLTDRQIQKEKLFKIESENARLLSRMQKDRETYRCNTEQLKKSAETLSIENTNMKQQILSALKTHNDEIAKLKDAHAKELSQAVNDIINEMSSRHKKVETEMKSDFAAYKGAYETLEREFRTKLSDENERYKKLNVKNVMLQQNNARFQEKVDELVKLNEKLQNENEVSRKLISDQRNELENLRRTISSHSEIVKKLQDKVRKLKKNGHCGDDHEAVSHKIRIYQQKLEVKDEELFQLSRRLREQEEEVTRLSRKDAVSSEITSKLERYESELSRTLQERDAFCQAVQIKNKMLEDQNETLRSLKQDILKRTSEMAKINDMAVIKERDLEEQISHDRSLLKELQHELQGFQKRESRMERQLEQCLHDIDLKKTEISELEKQLRDRNNLINIIEEEVAHLKSNLDQEKRALQIEYQGQVQKLESLLAEKESSLQQMDSQKVKIESLEKDLSDYNNLCENQEREIGQLKKEIKVLLLEMDKQKKEMMQKLAKVKDVIGLFG